MAGCGGQRHFIGILHDLTPRVQLEARVREQTALARLGEMAAVIAHEVKNPLAAVRGAIQVIGRRLPADNRDTPIIAEIVARIDALDELLKDLLLFARTPHPRLTRSIWRSLLRTDGGVSRRRSRRCASWTSIAIDGHGRPDDGDAELLTDRLSESVAQRRAGDAGQGNCHRAVLHRMATGRR